MTSRFVCTKIVCTFVHQLRNYYMAETKDVEDLLKNIQEGLKAYSIKDLNKAIISVLNKKHDKTSEIDFVLESVAKQYNISVTILKKTHAKGDIQDAKQLCYCLLNKNLGLSIRHISERIFFNWPTSVAEGLKRFKTLDPSIKQHKEFLDNYEYLQEKLIKFITRKTTKQKTEV